MAATNKNKFNTKCNDDFSLKEEWSLSIFFMQPYSALLMLKNSMSNQGLK